MRFLVDAQLPKSLARFLRERGFDAVHTLELPDKNRTDDLAIIQISLAESRVVISKDVGLLRHLSRKTGALQVAVSNDGQHTQRGPASSF